MSEVVEAGAGPPAGEAQDDTEPITVIVEPAPAADDPILDAVLSAAETGVVLETGTTRGEPAGAGEADGGSDPAGGAGRAETTPAQSETTPAQSGTGPADAAYNSPPGYTLYGGYFLVSKPPRCVSLEVWTTGSDRPARITFSAGRAVCGGRR